MYNNNNAELEISQNIIIKCVFKFEYDLTSRNAEELRLHIAVVVNYVFDQRWHIIRIYAYVNNSQIF